jgi:hypothetical protein
VQYTPISPRHASPRHRIAGALAAAASDSSAPPRRDRAFALLDLALKLQQDLQKGLAADVDLKSLQKDPRFARLTANQTTKDTNDTKGKPDIKR